MKIRQIAFIFIIGLGLFGSWASAIPTSAQQQTTAPIEVFVLRDDANQRVEIYFANPTTGLSTVVRIDNFPPTLNPLNEFSLTANGVIFRDPNDGQPKLITPNGQILDLTFIPRRQDPLQRIGWVLSADRKTIAWTEIRFTTIGWEAELYTASLDGQNLTALPMRPILPIQATRRVAMLGVSNDGQRVFFDSEHLPELGVDELFENYQRVTAYSANVQAYFDLPNEPNCLCPALIANNGQIMLRLQPSTTVNGFDLHLWNLENNRERIITGIDVGLAQAGNLIINQEATQAAYMVGDNSSGEIYAIVLVDFASNQHRLLTTPSATRLRPVSFIDRNASLVVVDTVEQITYKLVLESGVLLPVANKIWLGTIQG